MFESWVDAASERAVAAGLDKATARKLAITLICELEGAFLLCRAMKSTEPMEIAGANAAAAARNALG